jgi:chromosomal replication initiation ATPase DnaA
MTPTLVQMVRVPIKGRVEILSMAEAQKLVADITQLLCTSTVESQQIKIVTANEFGIRVGELDGNARTNRVVLPRHVAMWLHCAMTEMSYNQIGARFPRQNGRPRDHGTVVHARNRMESLMAEKPKFREQVKALQKKLMEMPQ